MAESSKPKQSREGEVMEEPFTPGSKGSLSEERLLCSICLDMLSEPVTTACGHNFCKTCLAQYWNKNEEFSCPYCKQNFTKRPELKINTTLRDIVDDVKMKSGGLNKTTGEVFCDYCTGVKQEALKTCLVCMTSYCERHLEPHQKVSALKKHKLINPVENLEDYICQKHQRPLELFCREDKMCVCQFCTETDHKTHNTVPIEEESGEKKTQLEKSKTELLQMIQERLKKIEEIKHLAELRKKSTEKEIAGSTEVFTALIRSIERSQAELLQVMEEKQKAAERQAEGLIKDLEQEITELKRRDTELEQLCHTEDHVHLLQMYPTLSSPPHTKNWTDISINTDVNVETVRRALSQLQKTLNKKLNGTMNTMLKQAVCTELKKIRQYAVDVTLDPDTAHPYLILSEDGKQVTCGEIKQNVPDNPKRFDIHAIVLGKEGFSSGRFYYEVQVKGKTEWDVGVVRESVNRKGKATLRPQNGIWAVWLRNSTEYKPCAGPSVLLTLKEKPQTVGVFV